MNRILAFSLVSIALLVSRAQAQTSSAAEVARVIDKVRATYAGLTSWHFEHRIVIEEVTGGGPVNLADVTFITANQGPSASSGLNTATCVGLCRLEWTTAARGRVVLVRDGQATWLYSSARNEFVKGQALRDVASSVSGSMLLSVHVLPLMSFDEQQWTRAGLLESQTIDVGEERRDCYVLEAVLRSQGIPLPSPGSPSPPDPFGVFTPSGYLGILSLQALSTIVVPPARPFSAYVTTLSGTDFPRALFWIDKDRGLVLRRAVTQNSRKVTPTSPSVADAVAPVELRLTDTFTLAKTGSAVTESLFHFDPPVGARQVARQ